MSDDRSQTTSEAEVISLEEERKKKEAKENAKHFAAILKLVEHFK